MSRSPVESERPTPPPTTPPPQQTTKPKTYTEEESPRVVRLSHQGAEREVQMGEVRDRGLQDFGPSIPEISFEQFKTAVLPHVDNGELEKVYKALKEGKELSDEGWMGLEFDKAKPQWVPRGPVQGQVQQSGQGTPALDAVQEEEGQNFTRQSAVAENALYKPLAGKFNKVLEHTHNATKKRSLIKFASTPTKSLKTESEHGGYIADINALLVDTTAVGDQARKKKFECDIVMTGEFKKVVNASGTDDNISKLIGNINHIMGSDPTRRFTYGMTVEHTDTRFWFCSRSHIFVTEKLDLQKNVKDVIYFVMALGTASKEQLGFDPTVRRVQRGTGDKSTRYRFTINGIEYETLEAISIYKAMFLLGRANRIFKVQRVVNNVLVGPELVLKDLWLPEGAKTELKIQQDIKDNINKVHEVEGLNAADFEKHFVSIQDCEIVKVPSMVNPNELVHDDSTNFLRGKDLSDTSKKFVLKLITTQSQRPAQSIPSSQMTSTAGTISSARRAQTQDIRKLSRDYYSNKAHHRIVMEHAGRPLQDERNLRKVVACIGKAATGLSFMFSAGMVHRDISTGNLLVSEVDGELLCKITDLEYAKKVGASSQSPQDIKTGTPYFMAVEIWRGYPLFRLNRPRNRALDHFAETTFRPLKQTEKVPDDATTPNAGHDTATLTPVRYNYLHDLESLFWILMYFLLVMHPVDSYITQLDIQDRMRRFYDLFPSFPDFDPSSRIGFLQGNESIQALVKTSIPLQFAFTMKFAIAVSEVLRMEYEQVEALPDSAIVKYSVEPYKQLQSVAAMLADSDEKQIWLGDMFDIPEQLVWNTERTVQVDAVGSPRKRPAEEVADDLSKGEGKRSRQE